MKSTLGTTGIGFTITGRAGVRAGASASILARMTSDRILEDMDQGRDPSLRVIKARPWRDVVEEFIEKHVGAHVKARRARVRATRPCREGPGLGCPC